MYRRWLPYLAIVSTTLLVWIANYRPGAYLMGWDNIMPEFDIWLNLKRNLSGVWLAYRGLGVHDGMAHIANLMITLWTGLLSLILPLNLVRYTSILSHHLLAGMGMYVLMLSLLRKYSTHPGNIAQHGLVDPDLHRDDKQWQTDAKARWVALICAHFYQYNIGTIQQYYAPLEVFTIHLAALPWLMWAGLRVLQQRTARSLLLYLLVAVLTTPQGFVPQVWIGSVILQLGLIPYEWSMRRSVRWSGLIMALYIVVNLFWILPYASGIAKNAAIIKDARINQYSSDEVYERNRARGDLWNTVTLQGFMLDTKETDLATNTQVELMAPWLSWLRTPWYWIGYVPLLGAIALGALRLIRHRSGLLIILPAGIAVLFLANNTYLLSPINALIRAISPTVAEAYRFPFTKLITLLIYAYTICLGYGLLHLSRRVPQVVLAALIAVVMIGLPAVTGGMFGSSLRVELPPSYREMFAYMRTLPATDRVLLLPAHTFWSWQSRSWGYTGSDFIWHGIPQAVIMRPFDPWSAYNEQIYNEVSYAVRTEDPIALDRVMSKYMISHILLDRTIASTEGTGPVHLDKLEPILEKMSFATRRNYGELSIYSRSSAPAIITVAQVTKSAPWMYSDAAYEESGDYMAAADSTGRWYPYGQLISVKTRRELAYIVESTPDRMRLTTKRSLPPGTYTIQLPSTPPGPTVEVQVERRGQELVFTPVYPTLQIADIYVHQPIELPRLQLDTSDTVTIELTDTNQRLTDTGTFYLQYGYPNTLKITQGDRVQYYEVEPRGFSPAPTVRSVTLTHASPIAIDIPHTRTRSILSGCREIVGTGEYTTIGLWQPDMSHDEGYVISGTYHHGTGLPLQYYIDSPTSKRAEVEYKLSASDERFDIFVPPYANDPLTGYSSHFLAKQYSTPIRHTVCDIQATTIPWDYLTHIMIDTPTSRSYVYTNSQAYDPGWVAYAYDHEPSWIQRIIPAIGGTRLTDHVQVNGWANGFLLQPSGTHGGQGSPELEARSSQLAAYVITIFWPQYLQYLGYIILIVTLGVVGWRVRRE